MAGATTQAQRQAEVLAAGYNGPMTDAAINQAYANAATPQDLAQSGLSNTSQTGSSSSTPSSPSGQQGANIPAAQLLLQQAQNAAQQAYLNSRLNLDNDTLAFQKATEAFNQTIQTANLTGTFNGQPTLAAQQQQAALTGMINGQPTEAARVANNQTALGYLDLISKLNGPADYGNYLRTLASTPNGLKSLVASAAGQYVPSAGTTGMAPTPQTLGSLLGAATGGVGAGQLMQGQQLPFGEGTFVKDPNSTAIGQVKNGQFSPFTSWQQYVGAGGPVDPTNANLANFNQVKVASPQQWQQLVTPVQPGAAAAPAPAAGTGSTTYGDYMSAAAGLPQPNQISPQSWNTYTTGQKQALLGLYGQSGWLPQDVQDLYSQSLPKYAFSGNPTGTVKI